MTGAFFHDRSNKEHDRQNDEQETEKTGKQVHPLRFSHHAPLPETRSTRCIRQDKQERHRQRCGMHRLPYNKDQSQYKDYRDADSK
jgi:hypothetical protein